MENVIIVIILIIIMVPAVRGCIKHFKGEGDCCGGPKEKAPKKKIKGTKLKTLKVQIEGMHCNNCKNRIEKYLDAIDGVVAKVSLEKKAATVSLYKELDTEVIKKTIEDLDFKVTGITEK